MEISTKNNESPMMLESPLKNNQIYNHSTCESEGSKSQIEIFSTEKEESQKMQIESNF